MNFKFAAVWGFAVFGTLALAPPAFACRILSPTAEQLAGLDTVLLVTVKSVERRKNTGWNTWDISTDLGKVLAGNQRQDAGSFAVTLSSDGCQATRAPKKGDRWVVYQGLIDGEAVQNEYPLSLVIDLDDRLKNVR